MKNILANKIRLIGIIFFLPILIFLLPDKVGAEFCCPSANRNCSDGWTCTGYQDCPLPDGTCIQQGCLPGIDCPSPCYACSGDICMPTGAPGCGGGPTPTSGPGENVNCYGLSVSGGSTTLTKGNTYTFSANYSWPFGGDHIFNRTMYVRNGSGGSIICEPVVYGLNQSSGWSTPLVFSASINWTPSEVGTYTVCCSGPISDWGGCAGACGAPLCGPEASMTVNVVSPQPNCSNVAGPTALTYGQSGTYGINTTQARQDLIFPYKRRLI